MHMGNRDTRLLIHDLGDEYCIEDRAPNSSDAYLECLDTKAEAKRRARNKWAAPGQPIHVVGLSSEVVRQGDPDWYHDDDSEQSGAGFGIPGLR